MTSMPPASRASPSGIASGGVVEDDHGDHRASAQQGLSLIGHSSRFADVSLECGVLRSAVPERASTDDLAVGLSGQVLPGGQALPVPAARRPRRAADVAHPQAIGTADPRPVRLR